jgi:hypothetical protein
MRWLARFSRLFRRPVLTCQRVWLAFVVAVVADGLQLLLGPLGWLMLDEVIDLLAMGLSCWLLGFHPLLLPTFMLEILPVVDMLPTWTGCVAVVVALRKRQQDTVVEPPPALPPS